MNDCSVSGRYFYICQNVELFNYFPHEKYVFCSFKLSVLVKICFSRLALCLLMRLLFPN